MHYIHFNLLFLTGISAVQAQYADEYSAFNDPQLADEYIAFNDPQLADEYFAFDDPQLEDLQPTAFEDLQPTAFGHLQPNVFDEEGNVDILQLFDTANTEVDISEDESNPDLFSILPDDQCAASTLAGKNRRRRNASCMSEGDMSGGEELINPAQKLEESLAEPTEHERANYAKGYLTPFALLVCSSGADREMKPLTFTTFTLYNSKRVYTPEDDAGCYWPQGIFCCDQWVPNRVMSIVSSRGTGSYCVFLKSNPNPYGSTVNPFNWP